MAAWLMLVPADLPAQSQVQDSLFAPALGRSMRYVVALPAGHDTSRSWPGIILLHGFSGLETDWSTFTPLTEMVAGLPLVVVMPEGNSAWYVNSTTVPGEQYEDYIMRDLRRTIARRYGVDTTRLSIGGLSMGGYGALTLALRHPRMFQFVAPFSSSLDIPMDIPLLEQHGRQGMRPELERAFGPTLSAAWTAHDPFTLASSIDTAGAPYFYIGTGIQDEFRERLSYHRRFIEVLRQRGFRYEYHESPGRHNWPYWSTALRGALRAWSERTGSDHQGVR
ncbi:MAG: esterase family protein [Bacteroidetes bacterium]|nr:esterase family protein [Bacteroidota bacterium]